MATAKPKTSIKAALIGDVAKKGIAELRSDIKALFGSTSGYELADAVVARVQRYAVETYGALEDGDFGETHSYHLKKISEIIRNELSWHVSSFISDTHREFVVRAHARGLSTSATVWELMYEDETINRLAHEDAMGGQGLRDALIPRLAYLKPGTARWPEKKYGAVWREARAAHKRVVSDIPFTSRVEQIALLAKHAERIERELDKKTHEPKDFQALTKSLTQTLESLHKLSAEEAPVTEKLSPPQLVAVLERLTLAMRAPDQKVIGGEAEELVGILERMALALKPPEKKRGSNGANALPAPADGDGENPE